MEGSGLAGFLCDVISAHSFWIGCEKLAEIEEDIVIAFTDVAGDDNNRITAILNQAYKVMNSR